MKKSLFFGLSALLAAGFTACKDDTLGTETGSVLDSDQTYFMAISISDASNSFGTRAYEDAEYDPTQDPEFDQGIQPAESKINSIFLLFYDEDGNRVGNTVLEDQHSNFTPSTQTSETGSVYNTYQGVVRVSLAKGEVKPTQVVAIINPISNSWYTEEYQSRMGTMKELEQLRLRYVYNKNKGFGMSNSVYYDYEPGETYNEAEANTIEPITSAKIKGELYPTEMAAYEAANKGDFNFDIFVERYAAKVKFRINSSFQNGDEKINTVTATIVTDINTVSGQPTYGDQDVTLNFIPDYWWVNAQEETTYVTKSYFAANGKIPSSNYLTYNDLVKALDVNAQYNNWKWNSKLLSRSYWAQSPTYYSEDYPRVSDDIMDSQADYNGKVQTPNNDNATYLLHYYTYNEIVELAKDNDPYNSYNVADYNNNGGFAQQYVKETTMSSSALNNEGKPSRYNYKAALPSIVVTGKYTVNGAPADYFNDTDNPEFYIQGNSTNGYTMYNRLNLEKWMEVHSVNVVGQKNNEGNIVSITPQQFSDYFQISHPNQKAREYDMSDTPSNGDDPNQDWDAEKLLIDARFVTMQLNEESNAWGTNDNLYYYDAAAKDWIQLTQDNIVKAAPYINRQLITALGLIRKFDGGLAYFNIPIKHLRFNAKYTNSDNFVDGKPIEPSDPRFEWNKVRMGDFGVVRNHVYTIDVTAITGLGTGIADRDTPIVPPVDEEEYYTAARINILNWAVVPTQIVELK